jgi:hypothetical protein
VYSPIIQSCKGQPCEFQAAKRILFTFISQHAFLQTTDSEPHAEVKIVSSNTKMSLRNPTQNYEACIVETENEYTILVEHVDLSEGIG